MPIFWYFSWKLDNQRMESDFQPKWWQGTFATKVAVRAIVTSDCHHNRFGSWKLCDVTSKSWRWKTVFSRFPTWELMSHPLIHMFDSLQHCWIRSLWCSCSFILTDEGFFSWEFPSTTATSFSWEDDCSTRNHVFEVMISWYFQMRSNHGRMCFSVKCSTSALVLNKWHASSWWLKEPANVYIWKWQTTNKYPSQKNQNQHVPPEKGPFQKGKACLPSFSSTFWRSSSPNWTRPTTPLSGPSYCDSHLAYKENMHTASAEVFWVQRIEWNLGEWNVAKIFVVQNRNNDDHHDDNN